MIQTLSKSIVAVALFAASVMASPIGLTTPGTVQSLKHLVSIASLQNPTCDGANCDLIEGILVNLPFLAISGDVVLLDANGGISDIVRFMNDILDTGGGTGLGDMALVYSKKDIGLDLSLGPDLGLPTDLSVNVVRIKEAAEGLPTLYDGNGTIYHIFSDNVPEPSSMVLIGSGLLGFALLARRRLA